MLTPKRRAFLQAAYSTLLRPSEPGEGEPSAPADENEQVKPKQGNDSPQGPGERKEVPPG